MAQLDTGMEALKWRRFYPKWLGLNDGLDEADRWYVEIRKEPSRKQVLEVARLVVSGDADGMDGQVMSLQQFIRGPFNLQADGVNVDSLAQLVEASDSHAIVEEIRAEVDRETGLSEEMVGNSGALSGGDTMQPEGATAEPASEGAEDAPASTAKMDDESQSESP